jgi:hypothetical protein
MAVEPSVVSPASLSEAYERMAEGGYRPLAGGRHRTTRGRAEPVAPR